MLIKDFELGEIGTNCYIVTDENTLDCAIIDPADESSTILDYVEGNKLKVKGILITHGHYDHVNAVEPLRAELKCPVYINKRDVCTKENATPLKFLPVGEVTNVDEGDVIECGSLKFDVMATPGHSEGSLTFKSDNCLFVGDTLFRDSCGRTDFPGGSWDKMCESLKRLYELEGDYEVYPGHMFTTTLDRERRFNPFMRSAVNK